MMRLLALWTLGFFGLLLIAFVVSLGAPWLSQIPVPLQVACGVLIVLSLFFLQTMLRERARAVHAMEEFVAAFEGLPALAHSPKRWGLSDETMDLVRRRGHSLRGQPKAWWARLDQTFESYSRDGRPGWYLTQSVQEALPLDFVVSRLYHSNFHQGVPGILTASGLLCTFAAILLGLGGVTYNSADPVHPVTGIDSLINGLSGKFVTSVIALVMSIIFLYCEKRICDLSISEAHEEMVSRCQQLFPYLSHTRVLLDIQAQLARSYAPGSGLSAERV